MKPSEPPAAVPVCGDKDCNTALQPSLHCNADYRDSEESSGEKVNEINQMDN